MTSHDGFSAEQNVPTLIDVLARHEGEAPGPLSLFAAASTEAGEVSVSDDDRLVFTPAEDALGPVTLSYSWRDANGTLRVGLVSGEVLESDDPVEALMPRDDAATIWQDTAHILRPALNDRDADGQWTPTTTIAVGEASHGTVELGEDGYVLYRPDPGFAGVDTFEYTAVQTEGPSGKVPIAGTEATGTVSIEVVATPTTGPTVYHLESIVFGSVNRFSSYGWLDGIFPGTYIDTGEDPVVSESRFSSNLSEAFKYGNREFVGEFWSFPVLEDGSLGFPKGLAIDDEYVELRGIYDDGGFSSERDLIPYLANLGGQNYVEYRQGAFALLAGGADDFMNASSRYTGDVAYYLAGGDDLLYAGNGNDALFGGDDDDRLYGGGGDDSLFGGDDDDRLDGDVGDDSLFGGGGDDQLYGGGGDNFFSPGAGVDEVYLAGDLDVVQGSASDLDASLIVGFGAGDLVRIETGAGYDVDIERTINDRAVRFMLNGDVDGDGGADVSIEVKSSAGRFWLRAEADGDDLVIEAVAFPAGAPIWGTGSGETLGGADFEDTLHGLGGADAIWGGKGDDVLHGGKGRDRLAGGNGRDELHGERGGGDVLIGGRWSDVFVVKKNARRDFIADWQDGMDRIRVDIDGMTFRDLKIVQRGEDALVAFKGAKASLVLNDVLAEDLGRADFMFA
ncbi:MAG: Ig-like domain-containing protein [Pseudomonadota bacterium]